jgi:methionine aminotransferase
MSQLASEAGAINLAQGFPGFGADPVLLELLAKASLAGHNQYAPMSGLLSLRQQIAEKTQRTQGYLPNADREVTVVSGASEAIFVALTAVVRPGDEVLVLEPAYDSYVPGILLNGGIPVFVSLDPTNFSVDWELLISKVTNKTRAILVNNPHNPSGYVWSLDEVKRLSALVDQTGIYVISDEVYERLVYDGKTHHSLGADPVLREKTFVCGSFGKTFHVTGWKIGYCIAPAELTHEFRKVHQFITFSTATPMQHALASYLEVAERYLSLPNFYQIKRDFFVEGLKETEFRFVPAAGSFFQLVSYAHLSDLPDVVMAKRLTKITKVACIPVSAFYTNGQDRKLLRFCFAKEESELQEALLRLKNLSEILR